MTPIEMTGHRHLKSPNHGERAHGKLVALAIAGAAIFAVGGCSLTNGGSPTSGTPVNWTKVAEQWANAYSAQSSHPEPLAPAATGQVVGVDIAAVASRLPAWRLADALQKEPQPNLEVVLPPLGNVSSLPAPQGTTVKPISEFSTAAQHVAPQHLGELRQEAEQLQLEAMREFTDAEGKRQDAALKNRLEALNAALLEDIAMAKRASPPEIAPVQLSDDVQFKLSNLQLRLQILGNMPVKNDSEARSIAAQQTETRSQIEKIESQWAKELQEQQKERLAAVNKMQVDQPAKMREAGEARIQRIGAAAAKSAATARQEVLAGQQALVATDFKSAGEMNYAIDLPSAMLSGHDMNLPGTENRFEPTPPSKVSMDTGMPYRSQTGIDGNVVSARRQGQIQVLRERAMRDARNWTLIAAHRAGWKLPEEVAAAKRPPTVPDRTADILHLLHLS